MDASAFDEYVAPFIGVDIWWHTARAIEVDGETGIVVGEALVDLEVNPLRATPGGAYALDGRATLC